MSRESKRVTHKAASVLHSKGAAFSYGFGPRRISIEMVIGSERCSYICNVRKGRPWTTSGRLTNCLSDVQHKAVDRRLQFIKKSRKGRFFSREDWFVSGHPNGAGFISVREGDEEETRG